MGGSSDQGPMVPLGGSRVIDDDQKGSEEEEKKAEEGSNGGGEVVATPLDDLNIQWTTSTSGSSAETMKDPLVGGDAMVVDDGSEGVPVTNLIEPSAQPILMEEDRDVVLPAEEVVVAEEVETNEEESGGAVGDRWRVRPRSGKDVVMMEWGSRETVRASGSGGVGGSGDDPKGKKVATEEFVREQGPVGISLGNYVVHAGVEDVAALSREASGILDVVRKEVVGQTEKEMDVLY